MQCAGGRIDGVFRTTPSDGLADQCGSADVKADHGKKGEVLDGKGYVGSRQFQIPKPTQHLNEEREPENFKKDLNTAWQAKAHKSTEELFIK